MELQNDAQKYWYQLRKVLKLNTGISLKLTFLPMWQADKMMH